MEQSDLRKIADQVAAVRDVRPVVSPGIPEIKRDGAAVRFLWGRCATPRTEQLPWQVKESMAHHDVRVEFNCQTLTFSFWEGDTKLYTYCDYELTQLVPGLRRLARLGNSNDEGTAEERGGSDAPGAGPARSPRETGSVPEKSYLIGTGRFGEGGQFLLHAACGIADSLERAKALAEEAAAGLAPGKHGAAALYEVPRSGLFEAHLHLMKPRHWRRLAAGASEAKHFAGPWFSRP